PSNRAAFSLGRGSVTRARIARATRGSARRPSSTDGGVTRVLRPRSLWDRIVVPAASDLCAAPARASGSGARRGHRRDQRRVRGISDVLGARHYRPTWVFPHTTPSRNTIIANPSLPRSPSHLRLSIRSV